MKKLLSFLCLAAVALSQTGCQRKKPGQAAGAPPPIARPGMKNQGVNLPVGSLPPGTQLSYSSVSGVNGPFIAITFDDGPHVTNTPRLLDMLASRGIKATFFCVGTNVARYPNIVRRIVADGHEMANHTWNHPKMSSLSDSSIRSELDRATNGIVGITGNAPRMYRPPYGAITARQKQLIMSEYGYPTILWSVDPEDWKRPGPAVITSRILNATRPGGIVLVHDIHPPSVDAMPATLDGLLARGFRFVTCSQLIAMGRGRTPGPNFAAASLMAAPPANLFTPGSL
jgi:peptidoglycan-N-acetylglucosamine deacetylase